MTPPPEPQPAKRDYSLIAIGVVVAMLLAVLLALPFFTGTGQHVTRTATSGALAPDSRPAPVR